jgi:RNA polymerase sigma-70 factor, ECF subfamily
MCWRGGIWDEAAGFPDLETFPLYPILFCVTNSIVDRIVYEVRKVTAFDELYERYAREVYRFSLYLSADRSLAEDITSETFVRAWTSDSPLRMPTVKAYLLTIARNLFVEELRRRSKQAELSDELPVAGSLAERTEHNDVLDRVAAELQRIPEGDRAALLMRVLDEMKYEEIARALGISLTAVKARIFRARLRLLQIREDMEWKTLK